MAEPPRRQTLLAGLIVALVIGTCEYNTVLNNAYEYGSTLHDSAIFATMMWRSGWLLQPAPIFDVSSYFIEHIAPINYAPDLVSYLYPGDRMTFYALVYALVYVALGFVACQLLREVAPRRFGNAIGVIGAAALFCTAPVFRGQWEPHMEVASPIFAILMFRAWQLRQYKQAILWLICNAAIREDLAVTYAVPLFLLAAAQYLRLRQSEPRLARERRRWVIILCSLSLALSVAGFAVQKIYFPGYNLFSSLYYDPNNLFGHLSGALISERAARLFVEAQGIWLPLVLLALAAAAFRDAELLVGAVAFLPSSLVFFLSKHEMSALLESYKAFPFGLVMVWPAIIALCRPGAARRRYLWLQAAVLVCGIVSVHDGRLYFIKPGGLEEAADRWVPQPYSANAEDYRAFGARLATSDAFGRVRASQGVLALYPYDFDVWYRSNLEKLDLSKVGDYDTFIWFDDDRDADIVDRLLKQDNAPRERYRVAGTKIEIATRKSPDDLSDFDGVLLDASP